MPRSSSLQSDPAPDISEFDRYSDYKKEDRLWVKRESRRKKKYELHAAAAASKRRLDSSTSAHTQRMRLFRINEDTLLAAECPPPHVYSMEAELELPNNSHAKLWYWKMSGEDLSDLSIDDAKKGWRSQYRRWWIMVKLDKHTEIVRKSVHEALRARRDRTGRVMSPGNAVRVLEVWRTRVLLNRRSAYAAVILDRERYIRRISVMRSLFLEASIDPDLFKRTPDLRYPNQFPSAQARRFSNPGLEGVLQTDRSFASVLGESVIGDEEGFVAHLGAMCFFTQCFHDDEQIELLDVSVPGPYVYPCSTHPVGSCGWLNLELVLPLSVAASKAVFVRTDPVDGNCGKPGSFGLISPLWDFGLDPDNQRNSTHMPLNLSPVWLPGKKMWVGMGRTTLTIVQLDRLKHACARYLKSRPFWAEDEAQIATPWRACSYDIFHDIGGCDSDGVDFNGVVADFDEESDWMDVDSDDCASTASTCAAAVDEMRILLVAYLKGIPREHLGRVRYRTSAEHPPGPVFSRESYWGLRYTFSY